MAQSCARCSDAGVLGPVPGVIGTLQALEVVKLAAQVGSPMVQKLLLFDALSCSFRSVKLRSRRPECAACGHSPSITADSLPGYDYIAFTGQGYNDKAPPALELLPPSQRISAAELAKLLPAQLRSRQTGTAATDHTISAFSDATATSDGADRQRPLLLDVRPKEQFSIASLPGSVSLPFNADNPRTHATYVQQLLHLLDEQFGAHSDHMEEDAQPYTEGDSPVTRPVMYVICRRGNDSQRVVNLLNQAGVHGAVDVAGGLQGWSSEADPGFPIY